MSTVLLVPAATGDVTLDGSFEAGFCLVLEELSLTEEEEGSP
jgi:hypothetical protein